jgi:hypothetical protein
MRIALVIAAGLTMVLAAAHSYLGERYILIRLFRRNTLPKLLGGVEFTKQTLRFAWHITGVAWLGLASLLLLMSSSPSAAYRAQARVIAAVFGLSGVAALLGSRGRHLSWIVFFAIAALVWLGYP